MPSIPVFAGLGSESLYSTAAALSVQKPESHILLRTCLDIFTSEIRQAYQQGVLESDSIRLADFDSPAKLLNPSSEYQSNVVVQHSTLYLSQMIRYLESNSGDILASVGFCAGLLPAAVVATSKEVVALLSRAQDLYYVAVWLGIRSECYRQSECRAAQISQTLPWSLVVHGLSMEESKAIIATEAVQDRISITANNASNCVTISGRGDHLESFAAQSLTRFRVRPTNVYSLYHNHDRLASLKEQVLKDFVQRSSSGSLSASLVVPLSRTSDGAWADLKGDCPLERLVSALLDQILLESTEWVAVQASIASLATEESNRLASDVAIVNYGPGYGMSSSAQRLPDKVKIQDATPSSEQLADNDIAIVGMAVELPDAPDITTFWANIMQGVNSCTEIPSSRFDIDEFYRDGSTEAKSNRTLKTRYGNFLQNPFLFDNRLFDISRREAASMDPQQRVMLQVAYRALEDAGYTPDSTPSNSRDTFGCWIGNATMDYTDNLRDDIDVYYSPGTLRTFQSARISYVFGWSGPSITLDTACSSSVVALHQAARSIAAGDCRSALVGAVNTITSPDMYLGLDRAHFLSPSGQCKAFDASADGYCRAEGSGAFIIKRVKDALADGDRIHAIIKAVDINQSGNAHSITHPHVPTQQILLESMFEKAKINPLEVSAVELHGTGTQAGDPNEVASIRRVLCNGRQPSNTVHFTSVKANIGHCEAASGCAGLAKLVLMLKNQSIPGQISLKNLNPKIAELGVDGALISRENIPWTHRSNKPRLALLNNFGAGGSNGTVLLQEYVDAPKAPVASSGAHQLLGISAKSEESLMKLVNSLVAHLGSATDEASLRDICSTMTSRRLLKDHRIAVTANTVADLIQELKSAEPRQVKQSNTGNIVFAFSGQGSQYMGMGRELMSSSKIFLDTVNKCDDWLVSRGFPGCKEIIAGADDDGSAAKDASKLQAFQVAIFVLEVAVAQILTSWGIVPAAVMGHSLGEYAALVTAQVLHLFDGLALVARRAQLMKELCEKDATAMLAVNTGAAEVRGMLEANVPFQRLEICCSNSETDCVLGGPRDLLREMKAYLGEIGTKSKMLDVPMAFHTKAMDPILEQFTAFAQSINTRAPQVAVVSNVYGRLVAPGEDVFSGEYFVRHCRNTVQFNEGAADLFRSETGTAATALVEIGPHPSLLPALGGKVNQSSMSLLPTIKKGSAPTVTLSKLLKELYLTRSDVNWRNVYTDGGEVRMLDLPVLPFSQEEFRCAYKEHSHAGELVKDVALSPSRKFSFLQRVVKLPSDRDGSAIFETPIQDLRELIVGHHVGDYPLCPASVYHEMVLSAVSELEDSTLSGTQWSLSQINYTSPLLFQEGSNKALRVQLEPVEQNYRFSLTTHVPGSNFPNGPVHCEGVLKRKSKLALERKYARQATALRQKRKAAIRDQSAESQILTTKAMYEKIFTRVVDYSPAYQKVVSLKINEDCSEAFAVCTAPDTRVEGCDLPASNSIFMDVLLHVAGFVANLNVKNDVLCICKEVRSAQVLRHPTPPGERFEVMCTLTELPAEHLTVADAYAVDARGDIIAHFKGMAFQSVPLAKINQAFAMITAKANGVPVAAAAKRPAMPAKQITAKAAPQPTAAPASTPRSAAVSISTLIAKTCGVPASTISEESRLDELGVDSLMMLELQSELTKVGLEADPAALAEAETVGDLERLCGSGDDAQLSSCNSSEPDISSDREDQSGVQTPLTQPDLSGGKSSVLLAISDVCGADADTLTADAELHSLGIDSLMMLELQEKLARMDNGQAYSAADLSGCNTVGDIERLINGPSSRSKPARSTATVSQVPLAARPTVPEVKLSDKMSRLLRLSQQPETVHDKGSSAPLFLIHDGSGVCPQYHRISPINRPIYALHNSKFTSPASSWTSLESMAEEYAKTISSKHRGPLLIGGWSFGGVVAFQASRLLQAQGIKVLGVVLIDSPPPLDHQPLSAEIIEAVTASQGGGPNSSNDPQLATVRKLVQHSFSTCASLLGAFKPQRGNAPKLYLLRSKEGWRREGSWKVENAWLQDRKEVRHAVEGWKVVSERDVPVLDIPGNHFQPFEKENVGAVSKAIGRVCVEMEG